MSDTPEKSNLLSIHISGTVRDVREAISLLTETAQDMNSDNSDVTIEVRPDLDDAKALLERYAKLRAQLRGKRISVTRALVYEGDADVVFAQLSRSLAPGEHLKPGRKSLIDIDVIPNLKILIVEGEPEEVL